MQPIACSSLTFAKVPLEQALKGVAALGFGHVDLAAFERWAHVAPSALAADLDAQIARVQAAVAREGLTVTALNVGLGDASLAERKARLAAVCALATALSVKVLTLQPPQVVTPLDEAVRLMRATQQQVHEAGLIPAFETHTGTVMEDPAIVLQLAERIPNLQLTLDHSHYVFGNVRSGRWVELLPFAAHVHLRDSGPGDGQVQVEPGTGEVPVAELVRRLIADRYTGPVSLEYIDGMGKVDAPACSRTMRDQITAMLAASGGGEKST